MSRFDFDNALTELLYARGFLLARRRIDVPVAGWEEIPFGEYWLYRDPRVGVQRSTEGSTTVLLVGRAILLGNTSPQSGLANHLANDLLVSRQRFDESVEHVCGNYVLMTANGHEHTVQSDAAGLRSIFYSPDGEVVGSHASLVAAQSPSSRFTQFHDPSWESRDSVSYLPGLRTIHDGVLQLTPNTELHLETMMPRRVFPRRPPLSLEVSEVVNRVSPLLAIQSKFLVGSGQHLMLSLTAGIDSRTSLAVLRPIAHHLTAFTYVLEFGRFADLPIIGIDEAVASKIASDLSLTHRLARIGNPAVRPELEEVLEANTHHEHIWPLAQWYLDNLASETLHIRSNVYEIGRAFYRKSRPRLLPLDPGMMAETHRRSNRERPAAIEAFVEFHRLTDFDSLHGHDPYDLFYWEHRVGRWHANVVAESDISHETWVLINSRRILELLLAAPLAQRIKGTVFSELIDSHWPALSRLPFNRVPTVDVRPATTVSRHGSFSETPPMSNNDRISEVYKGEIWTDDAQERARRRIHWIASQARGNQILDIGCSQGITSILLGREGFEVTGIDIEASRIEYAKADLALESEQTKARVTFAIADGGELGFEDDSFDTVLLGEVLEHLVAPERVLAEVARVLRPRGIVVITTPFGFLHHHDHKQTFFPTSLFALISPYVGIVSAEIGDRYFRLVGQKGSETNAVLLDSLQEQADGVVRGIQEELLDVRKRVNQLLSDLDNAAKSAAENQKRLEQVEGQLLLAKRERDNLKNAWRETKSRLEEITRDHRSITRELKKANQQLKSAEETHKRLLKQDRDLARMRHKLEVSNWKLASLRQRRWWRLGSELGEVRRRPQRLLTLPARLVRVLRSRPPRLPRPQPPQFEKESSTRAELGLRPQPIIPRHDVAALVLARPELVDLLSHELQLFSIVSDAWQGQITSFAPRLLIADATSLSSPPEYLTELLDSAHSAGITTVFWDEEGSTTPDRLRAQFDVIAGHSKARPNGYTGRMVTQSGLVQPMIHNPIGAKRKQDSGVVDIAELVLGDTHFSSTTELAAASKDFKILQTLKAASPVSLAVLAATCTPVISSPAGSNRFTLGAESDEEAKTLGHSLLKSEVWRARLTHPKMREAIRENSIGSVVNGVLGHPELTWPVIDIMVATKRAEKLEFLFENLGRQTYPNTRLFLVAHGITLDEEHTKSLAQHAGVHLAAIVHVPETVILGEVFNIGFGETEADIVAKMDDDDIYGAEYLWDLYSALEFSGAEVAGKWAHYAYLEGPDTLVYRYRDYEHCFTDVVAISTLLMRREVLEAELFPAMPWGSGSVFLRALGAKGGRVFASDRWNYLYVRGQDGGANTFPISDLRLLSISDVVCRGMNVEEVTV